jgi:hypothetical protein
MSQVGAGCPLIAQRHLLADSILAPRLHVLCYVSAEAHGALWRCILTTPTAPRAGGKRIMWSSGEYTVNMSAYVCVIALTGMLHTL